MSRSLDRPIAGALGTSQLAQARALLEHEHERLRRQQQVEIERRRAMSIDEARDAHDTIDEVESTVEREELFADRELDWQRLLLVEEALQRLDEGRYGLCQATGRPIPWERLRAIPGHASGPRCRRRLEQAALGSAEPAAPMVGEE